MQKQANLMLLIVTILWGSSYLFMKMGLDSLQEYNLIALRFGIAFLLAALFFPARIRKTNRTMLFYAFILGVILFLVFAFIMAGIQLTSTSNAAFLVSLTVIFVPLLSTLLLKRKPAAKLVIGVGLALLGVGLLTLNHQLAINLGDLFCMMGALMYAIHILVTEKFTKAVDSLTLGIGQLGFTAVLALVTSLIFEAPRMPQSYDEWLPVLALSILCSAIGFVVQAVAQQHTNSTNTGLIFSLEPVFAALFAFLVFGETLSAQGLFGAILVLIGVIYAQTKSGAPASERSSAEA